MAAPQRNRLIGAVHAARKAADLDEDTYRAMLARVTGKSSAKDCSDSELRQVLDHMNGHTGARRFAPPKTTNPTAKKVRALWITLHALGGIEDPSEKALRAWIKRQYKVDDIAFVRPSDSFAVIEGLKQWCARLGVDWSAYTDPRLCVIERQIAIIRANLPSVSYPIMEAGLDLDKLILNLGRIIRGDHG